MSCKGALNIQSGKKYSSCGAVCNYEFKFNTTKSSCNIENKKSYLKIDCFDGTNDIAFSGIGKINVTEVRLYSKSINKWNDIRYDAELVIKHGGEGKTLYVCIPVTKGKNDNSASESINWFNSLYLKGVPTHNGGKSTSSPSGSFNLSMVMPDGGYYYLRENGLGWGGRCLRSSNSMIIFSNPIDIRPSDLAMLRKKINSTSATNETARTEDILYNKKGISSSSGDDSEYETICTPMVDQDGTAIDKNGNEAEWSGWIKSELSSINWMTILAFYQKYEAIIWVIIGVILLAILQYLKLPNKLIGYMIGIFEKKERN